MWYNRSDRRLNKGVAKLRRRINNRKLLQAALHPWWFTYWALVPVFATSLGVYLLVLYGVWQLLTVTLVLTGAYYATAHLMLAVYKITIPRLTEQLRSGKFGHAIMWEADAEWLAIQSALQAYGIIFMRFIDDPRIAPELTEYLMASRHVRRWLRAELQRPKPTHPAMIELATYAKQFAARIDTALMWRR
jgi:hypothetical protein